MTHTRPDIGHARAVLSAARSIPAGDDRVEIAGDVIVIDPAAARRTPRRRDPDDWAIYVRRGDHNGRALLAEVLQLGRLVAANGGRVAGIYGELGDPGGPEMGVMLGHALRDRFANVAVTNVAALGDDLDAVALTFTCLFDLRVQVYAHQLAGHTAAEGFPLDLDDVGREVLGAIASTAGYGRTIDIIATKVGTAPGRRRPFDDGIHRPM